MTRYRAGTGGADGPQRKPGAWPCDALRAEVRYLARLDALHGAAILRALARAPMLTELVIRERDHGRRCDAGHRCARCVALADADDAHARADHVAQTYARLRVCEWLPVPG